MRRLRRRSFGAKPTRAWQDISANWSLAVSATTAAVLLEMQAPTLSGGTAITADPPEDLTLLRIKGSFRVALTGDAQAVSWNLALTVQDTAWTPGATLGVDSDKRLLWIQTYQTPVALGGTLVTTAWSPPGFMEVDGTADFMMGAFAEATHIDIAPKVKLEQGKALYLVAYEENGALAFTTASENMRILYQRSARRR